MRVFYLVCGCGIHTESHYSKTSRKIKRVHLAGLTALQNQRVRVYFADELHKGYCMSFIYSKKCHKIMSAFSGINCAKESESACILRD